MEKSISFTTTSYNSYISIVYYDGNGEIKKSTNLVFDFSDPCGWKFFNVFKNECKLKKNARHKFDYEVNCVEEYIILTDDFDKDFMNAVSELFDSIQSHIISYKSIPREAFGSISHTEGLIEKTVERFFNIIKNASEERSKRFE